MATGTRSDLWLALDLIMHAPGPADSILTNEEADEMERKGFCVARIPVEREREEDA